MASPYPYKMPFKMSNADIAGSWCVGSWCDKSWYLLKDGRVIETGMRLGMEQHYFYTEEIPVDNLPVEEREIIRELQEKSDV